MSSNILHISKFILKSNLPPALMISPVSGKLYAVPDWVEFPHGTTLKQIHDIWNRNHTQPAAPVAKEFIIKSSEGQKSYKVTALNGIWTCTCTGFGFKNTCRHVTDCKNK